METAAPRSRRSPAAIRSLVLQAARELFAERGFDDVTSIRDGWPEGLAR